VFKDDLSKDSFPLNSPEETSPTFNIDDDKAIQSPIKIQNLDQIKARRQKMMLNRSETKKEVSTMKSMIEFKTEKKLGYRQ
jgi:hypothetical protein